jgi:uncharacterized delta-60 repeat protein
MWTFTQLRRNIAIVSVCAVAAASFPLGMVSAQTTTLVNDTTFGTDGVAEAAIAPGVSSSWVIDMVIDSQGKTVSLVDVDDNSELGLTMLVRTLSSGALDTSFSEDGKSDPISSFDATTLALQADGKILVGGTLYTQNGLHAVRFLENGQRDTDFGNSGIAASPLFGTRDKSGAIKLAVQSSGFVLATTFYSQVWGNNEAVVVAFDNSGVVNGNFGTAGVATVAPSGSGMSMRTVLTDVLVQADCCVVLVLNGMDNNGGVTWLAQFTANGILDENFDGANNGNGIVKLRDSNTEVFFMSALIIESDGSMTLAGVSGAYSGVRYVATMRAISNGEFDVSYGTNGITTTTTGGQYPEIASLRRSLAGLYFLTATMDMLSDPQNPQRSYVVSFRNDGTLNSSFDGDGVKQITNDGNRIARATSVEAQADGSVVAAIAYSGRGNPYELIRLSSDGTTDSTYGVNGMSRIPFLNMNYPLSGQQLVEQPDGKLVIASNVQLPGDDFWSSISAVDVVRLNTNGSIDTTFGISGHSRLQVSTFSTSVNDLHLQADGRVLVAVSNNVGGGEGDAGIFRLRTNGVIDSSFDDDGFKSFDFGNDDSIPSITTLTNGDIVVGGASDNAWILKMNSNGLLDTSFDGDTGTADGRVTLSNFWVSDVMSVNDGYVLVGSVVGNNQDSDAAMMKIDLTGRVTTTFATNGQATFPVSNGNGGTQNSWFSSVIARTTGGYVAMGGIGNNSDFRLVAFDASGGLDTSFDGPSGSGNGLATFLQPTVGNAFEVMNVLADGDGFIILGNTGTVALNGPPTNIQPALRRITATGTYDGNFGSSGQIQVASGISNSYLLGGLIGRDGAVAAVGYRQTGLSYGGSTFVNKLRQPQSTPTTTSPVVTTPTTTVPSVSPVVTTPTTTVPSVSPVVTTPTTTVPPVVNSGSSVPALALGKLVSRTSLLKKYSLTVPKGGKVSMTATTPKTCKVVGTSIKGLAKGTCSVRFTITPKKGAAKKHTKTLKIT